MTTTPGPMVPRKKVAKMMPRPKRKARAEAPNPTPVSGFSPPAAPIAAELAPPADPRAPWERYSDALAVIIRHEADPCERDMLRLRLLAARHTPWR